MADKLVSMKVDKAAREKKYAEPTVAADSPEYPWGLQLNLGDEELEKLGVEDLPGTDVAVKVYAVATVTRISVDESDGAKRRSMTLQITDLCLEPVKKKKSDLEILFAK